MVEERMWQPYQGYRYTRPMFSTSLIKDGRFLGPVIRIYWIDNNNISALLVTMMKTDNATSLK